MIVVLDSEPLGLLVHPRQNSAVYGWMRALLAAGHQLVVPEIVYYELRRELVRIQSSHSLAELDRLADELPYARLTRQILIRAGELWADARNAGLPTTPDRSLDVDVILAATAEAWVSGGDTVVIATSNVRHLARFVPARRWDEIQP